jgi:glycosyltransferase involved in cell wall biosynthesis
MRILHVNKFLHPRGGAESYMLNLAELQRATGHEVEFFGMDHRSNPPQRFAAHFPRSMQLDPLPPGLRRRAAAAGRMIYLPAARRGMEEVLRSFRPHVAHLHNIYHHLSPSVLPPLTRAGVPAVMTLHDYKLVCPSYLLFDHGRICEACLDGSFLHAVVRRCKDDSLGASAALVLESTVHRLTNAYGSVQVFICPSRFLADKMTQAGLYQDRLHVLSNFIDVRGVEPKTHPGGPVVYAGRLWPEKGVDVLIEAMARLGAGQLMVVGDGPERARLEALAAVRAPGQVRFHGWLPRDRVLELVRSATVLAAPSRSPENHPWRSWRRSPAACRWSPPRSAACPSWLSGPVRRHHSARRPGRAGDRARAPARQPSAGPGDGFGRPGPGRGGVRARAAPAPPGVPLCRGRGGGCGVAPTHAAQM